MHAVSVVAGRVDVGQWESNRRSTTAVRPHCHILGRWRPPRECYPLRVSAISRYGARRRARRRLPKIVDSRLRGNDVGAATTTMSMASFPLPAKAGSGNPQTVYRTSGTAKGWVER